MVHVELSDLPRTAAILIKLRAAGSCVAAM